MLKSSFNFLGAIMKCQRCNESEAFLESGVGFGGAGGGGAVLGYATT